MPRCHATPCGAHGHPHPGIGCARRLWRARPRQLTDHDLTKYDADRGNDRSCLVSPGLSTRSTSRLRTGLGQRPRGARLGGRHGQGLLDQRGSHLERLGPRQSPAAATQFVTGARSGRRGRHVPRDRARPDLVAGFRTSEMPPWTGLSPVRTPLEGGGPDQQVVVTRIDPVRPSVARSYRVERLDLTTRRAASQLPTGAAQRRGSPLPCGLGRSRPHS